MAGKALLDQERGAVLKRLSDLGAESFHFEVVSIGGNLPIKPGRTDDPSPLLERKVRLNLDRSSLVSASIVSLPCSTRSPGTRQMPSSSRSTIPVRRKASRRRTCA